MASGNVTVTAEVDIEAVKEYLANNDYVQVVRCKNCKYYGKTHDMCCQYRGDDYCSYGEVKNERAMLRNL